MDSIINIKLKLMVIIVVKQLKTKRALLKIVPIFLLGRSNLMGKNEAEQDAETNKILNRLGIITESKVLVRKEKELNEISSNGVDVFIVFPYCAERFTPLIRVTDSKIPVIIVGEENGFANALDTYEYLADKPNVEIAFTAKEVSSKIEVVNAAKWVKTAKVCVFGVEDFKPEASAWYKNPIGLGKLNTHCLGKEKLLDTFKRTDRAEAERLAKRWISECEVREPSFEDVVLSARVYLAMKTIIEENQADAAYVLWCGQFTKGLGTKMCFAIAKLADDGIPVGCWKGENLLPMLILHAATHKAVFVCQAHTRESNTITLRHCFAPSAIANCKYVLRRWRDMEGTVTGYCQLPKGETTLVNCGIGDKIVVVRGKVLDCKDLGGDNCRMTIWVELENEDIIRKFVGKEFAMVYGDCEKQAEEIAVKLGLQVL